MKKPITLAERIARDIDKQAFKDLRKCIPPKEPIKMEVSIHNCVFGHVLIGSEVNNLLSVELGSDADECYRNFINRWSKESLYASTRKNMKIVDQVLDSINSGVIDISIQIRLTGTYFQKEVWKTLQAVQPSETVSYTDIAQKIKRPDSVRAIGNACGANPIAIIVPCHRAIRADGKGGGYRWGNDLKQKLLDREKNLI